MSTRHGVFGEDAPAALAAGLGVIGLAGTALCAWLVVTVPNAPPFDPRTIAPPTTVSPVPTPEPSVTAPPATASVAAAPASAAAPPRCPPAIFRFNLAAQALDPAERAKADALGAWLVRRPETTALVHGHADALGSEEANLALSRQRANAVADRLAKAGVLRARVTVRGFGAYQPVEGAPEEAASNRRVVVYVKNTTECPPDTAGVEK